MIRDVKPIYDRWCQELIHSPRCLTSEADRMDQAMLEVHLRRIGNATVMRVGYSGAILGGMMVKLDPADYGRCAEEAEGEILIPATFARRYFDEPIAGDERDYVSLKPLCEQYNAVLCYDRASGLVGIIPPSVLPFDSENDPAFIKRISQVFNDPRLPDPKFNNAEQSRTVIDQYDFPTDFSDYKEKEYYNLYTPDILISKNSEGGKRIYVSHEYNRTKTWQELDCSTALKYSDDDGKTWQEIARVENLRWAKLFELNGSIYLFGSQIHPEHSVKIARLEGSTFRESVIPTRTWTQANAHVVHNGRIFMPTFPMIMSADVNADLLDPASWRYSDAINGITDREWLIQTAGVAEAKDYWPLETNLVVSPEGELYNIFRLEMQPNNGYAGLLKLSDDGLTHTFPEPCHGLVHMPTSVTKFCVRYDEATKLYLTLSNYPSIKTPAPSKGPPLAGHRNVLCLAASEDLIHWKHIDTVLVDREVINAVCSAKSHAFQYTEWVFDGDDILFVVREAIGYTNTYHDGRCVTFYRLKDYAKLVRDRFDQAPIWTKDGEVNGK